jgi:lipoprotein-releasing system ATP-binding protein
VSQNPRFSPLLLLEDVRFRYGDSPEVLRGVNFLLERGETVALYGASGSGKSTLLFLAGLLASPTSGRVLFDGHDASDLSETTKERLRNKHLGFVFQYHFLLPDFTTEENVAIPTWIQEGRRRPESLIRAREILDFVGLGDKLTRHPHQLSGGERQRVAIARALAHGPDLILADEPTGSLDTENGQRVFQLLMELQIESRCGILLVTHNPDLASLSNRTVTIEDGLIGGT